MSTFKFTVPPLSSPPKPNISLHSPAASKSSSQTQLLSSISSLASTVSHPQPPTLVSDTKEQPYQAHDPRKDSKKTDFKKVKPTTMSWTQTLIFLTRTTS
ncbi:hypothetical protein TNCV_2236881 [Trichonephila clavipes]|nr:hypothetical protein TNCV_2236881 [Trichonephila clavipes]